MELAAGELWDGRYRIDRLLGRGAAGDVYRAFDTADADGPVALKILRREAMKAGRDDTLRLEFALLARFRHPNLVGVRRFATRGDVPFLVVEVVDGPTLDRAVRQPDDLLALATGVLRGLAYLHGNGFVHQDVKPSNILVAAGAGGEAATPKLADLGIAALRGVAAGDHVAGTLAFLSPERLRGAQADPRADLWALGITLHACAAGRLPVRASTSDQLARRLEAMPIVPLRDACPGAPVELERFTARLLALDPRERFRDAGDALADLERTLGVGAAVVRSASVQGGNAVGSTAPAQLIGRDVAIARAQKALAPRAQPVARTVWVCAPAGLGRTRVLDELAVLAQLAGAPAVRVAQGRGLAPWIGALGELGVGVVPDTASGHARASSIGEQLDAALSLAPGVLIVDDLDRRDGLARDLVDRIAVSLAARSIRHTAGVVVATGPDAMPADRRAAIEIDLPPLAPAAIRELAGSALGAEPPAAVAALLVGEAGGSPGLALAALRGLIETGALRRVGGAWELIEDGRAALRRAGTSDRRVAGLPASARAALDALALFGPGAIVELAVLGAAATQGGDDLAAAVGALCAAQLVAVVPGGAIHRSEAIRATCAAAVGPGERAAIHRRAWDALRARGVDDPAVLCHHAIGAGLAASAHALAVAAAEAAAARGDHLSALAAADVALTAAAAAGFAVAGRPLALLRARALLELGRVAEARAALAAAPADPDDVDGALLVARLAVAAGEAAALPDAIAALERLGAAGRLDAGQRGELAVLRVEAARLRDPRAALAASAGELASLAGDDRRRWRLHSIVGQAAIAAMDLERARAELEAALPIAERLDDPAAIVEIRGWLAAVCDMGNRGADAMAHVERGLEHAARCPIGLPFARLLNLRGLLLMWSGRLDAAAESLLEAERCGRVAGASKVASSAAGNLVAVNRRRGLYGQALAAALRSLALKHALGDRAGRLMTFANLTDLYTEFGDLARAEACARRCVTGGRALGYKRIWAQGLLSLAGVLVETGDREGAHAAIAESRGAIDEHNLVEGWIIEGKLARADGDAAGSIAALTRAIEHSRAIGNSHDEGRALLERAALAGDLVADDLRRAAEVAVRTGSHGVAWTAHARLAGVLRATGAAASVADRELARARELLAVVLNDLSPRHQARYRAAPMRRELVAIVEAAPVAAASAELAPPDDADDAGTTSSAMTVQLPRR